jgi:hypothetical protein
MLRDWEAEKRNLVINKQRLKVVELRKKLKRYWIESGRSVEEVNSVEGMKKKEVCKQLYEYYHIRSLRERGFS